MKRQPLTHCLLACLAAAPLALFGCEETEPEAGAPEQIEPASQVLEPDPPDFDPDTPVDLAVQGNNALAVDLYRTLVSQGEAGDNLFFSPVSVSAALMLTYEGSRGETQAEFEQVLGLSEAERADAHDAYAGVLGRLSGQDRPYELSVANGLWGEQTMPFREGLLDTLGEHYEAGFASVDFVNDSETHRVQINDWVSSRTQDRINNLLPPRSVNPDTRLVLVNALYFKAEWMLMFEERATRDEDFYLISGDRDVESQSVGVPMMRQSMERFRYGSFEGYEALEMWYEGRDLSMLVLLPDESDGLADLEAELSADLIDQTIAGLSYETINRLRLPKWEMTLEYDLVPALRELGMDRAFVRGQADFTGLSDSAEAEDLFISGVFHKAFIAVDEAGTEAAAATAVVIEAESAVLPPEDPIEFIADHPFVYLIRDNRTGAILFMGRVTDPS